VQAVLGGPVQPGQGTELDLPGGTKQSCRWALVKGLGALFVTRTVFTRGEPATNRAQYFEAVAGRLEPVPGDPDQAAWQVGQGDATDVTLHAFRGNAGLEVRVTGVAGKDVKAVRGKVLRLKRW
jgi:hypothetical protein